MQLLKTIRRYFSGEQTEYIQRLMNNFTPISEQSISDILKRIYKSKVTQKLHQEYSPYNTQTQQKFVQRIQRFYFNSQQFNRATLRNYYKMEEMGYTNSTFKFILARKLSQYLIKDSTIQTIKNERLQNLLWFLKKQFPMQPKFFQDSASLYSIRLYDLAEYMNSLKTIPQWEPYIRVCYILKSLGHQINLRSDILQYSTLQKIDYKYFYFLSQLIPQEKYEDIQDKLKITQPFLTYLLQKFFIADQIKYDQYLQRLELIDNLQPKEEINQSLDVISWSDVVYIFYLAAKSYYLQGQQNSIQHKFYTLFDRKFQTLKIHLLQAACITEILSEFPNFMSEHRNSIITAIVQSIMQLPTQQFEGVQPEIYFILLKNSQNLSLDRDSYQKFCKFLLKNVKDCIYWDQDIKLKLLKYLQSKQFQEKGQISTFIADLKTK